MPTFKQHRSAVTGHLRAYRATVDRYPAWASVMLFYAALHLLEHAFAQEGVHNNTHSQRELYIKQRHSGVWPAYSRLQSESLKARYLQGGSFGLNSLGVQRELRRVKYREIRRYLRGLLRSV